jgi:uncharacterized membrane protein
LRDRFRALLLTAAFVGLGTGATHASITGTDLYTFTLSTPVGFSARPYFGVAAAGGQVVSSGYRTVTGNNDHAVLWSGSAGRCIDLQGVLPATFTSSEACSISGDTVYGTATDASGNFHAIAWTVSVPEPASVSLVAIASLGLLRRPRGMERERT